MPMRHLYSLILLLILPLVALRLLLRGLRNPAYWRRWGERFGLRGVRADGPVYFWVHAVSVGETVAAIPLIEELLRLHPEAQLVLTNTTPTGSDRARAALGDRVLHQYAPYDLSPLVGRFLERLRPAVAIFMETELWPNTLHHCERLGVRVVVANARLSARSATGYARLAWLTRPMLTQVSLLAAQTGDDAERFHALGLPIGRSRVTGSIKFDIHLSAAVQEQGAVLRRQWGVERSVWIAASTHEGEEQQVLDAFEAVLKAHPDCLLVLVPRHPERFDAAESLCQRRGLAVVRRTRLQGGCEGVQVFIGDTMGELPQFYAGADVAFVGGSLMPVGGHNMLEPAALGLPVVVGPHLFNFSEISRMLLDAGAARRVEDAGQLAATVVELLSDANLRHALGERGQRMVNDNRGALHRVLALIRGLEKTTS